MKAVGTKQLKARLSEYIRLVKAGDTILVTERDVVVAELRPVRRQGPPTGDLEDVLDSLARADLTRSSVRRGDWTWSVGGLGLPRTGRTLLDDVRGDRDA